MAGYIGVVPTPQATQTRDRFEATAGQTSFPTSGYTPGFLDVYANGLKINSEAYTATNGSDVVFDAAREAGDVIEVVAYSTFEAGKVTPDAVSDKDNESTGYFALPSGTTAQRPVSAAAGYTRYNSEAGSIEFYDGANWLATNLIPTVDSINGAIYAGTASTLAINTTNSTDLITVRFSLGGVVLDELVNVAVDSGVASVNIPAGVYGQNAGDTINVSTLNQDGTPSSNSINMVVVGLPTGGTISSDVATRTHIFTSSGSETFAVPPGFSSTADILLVAGGGGGGGAFCGGGGAGGVVLAQGYSLSAGSYSIVVGAGGTGGLGWQNTGSMHGTDGGDTTAFGWTAAGGGGGSEFSGGTYGTAVRFDTYARPGGCGGGGSPAHPDMPCEEGGASDQQSFVGTTVYGTAGGTGNPAASGSTGYLGGGGGGAGQAGRNHNDSTRPGGGGNGVDLSSIFGTSVGDSGWFAGGGGASSQNTAAGSGGLGGGSSGELTTTRPPDGDSNTGGGGGASGYSGGSDVQQGANGGSGIVIIRYQL